MLNVIGFWLTMAANYGEADRYSRRAWRCDVGCSDGQPDVASSLMVLAILRDAEGKYPEALQLAQSAKGIYTAALSADHWRTAIAESAEGAALTGLGRYPEADAVLIHSYEILSKIMARRWCIER